MSRTLDLGCGVNPRNPFNVEEVFGVDVRDDLSASIKKADLAIESIPFENDFFEYVTAYDFLEHIPRVVYAPHRRNSFVEVMNEVYRVLKMGGVFLSFTPAYPHVAAFQDPTHVNYVTEDTFRFYFDSFNRAAKGYGFTGAFEVLKQEWREQYLLVVLRKVPVPAE